MSIVAIIPAAGVGKRMGTAIPKQYIKVLDRCILDITVTKLLAHPLVSHVVVAIGPEDEFFSSLDVAQHPKVISVIGGELRADSVLNALRYVDEHIQASWVLVHDAARPCVRLTDIDKLLAAAMSHPAGALLAMPARDTIKWAHVEPHEVLSVADIKVLSEKTIDRSMLWHALTPQCFPTQLLLNALTDALQSPQEVTDEASAIELMGLTPRLIQGRGDNIKLTLAEDIALVEFYLQKEAQEQKEAI